MADCSEVRGCGVRAALATRNVGGPRNSARKINLDICAELKLKGSVSFWDAIFGEKLEFELPDGTTRRVTKKWLQKAEREGKAKALPPNEVIRKISANAATEASRLLQSPSEYAEGLGTQIVLMSVESVESVIELWDQQLSDDTQVFLCMEFTNFLITYTDRLALGKFGEPKRSEFVNAVINRIKPSFGTQNCLGDTKSERNEYFEKLIAERFEYYSTTTDMADHIFQGARLMVEDFCHYLPEAERIRLTIETGKLLSERTVVALAVLPAFKSLL